jgi:predicted hotdog family 3-hydroxylacyl-ACP dehydratase
MSMLDKQGIARLIPHHGDMCLLDQVLHYDASSIHCTTRSHFAVSNPLRERNLLHAVCGVEYAAQAMAVHGALLAKQGDAAPRGGRLASVRSVEFSVVRLDDIQSELNIHANYSMGDENSMVYEFSVNAGDHNLLRGKATVVLMPQQ